LKVFAAALLFVPACGPGEPKPLPLRLDATIAFPPKDTIRLSLPASTAWCSDRHSLLLESVSPEGSGLLMRLRYRDSLTSDSLPLVPPDDTVTVPAAMIGIRFFLHDTPHGYSLDSGRVHVVRDRGEIRVNGVGVGVESAIRIRAQIESRDVPIGADTVPCSHAP
jgi:hypothetical protein